MPCCCCGCPFLPRLHPYHQALSGCLIQPRNALNSRLEKSCHGLNITKIHNLRYIVLCSKNRAPQFHPEKNSKYSHLVANNITHQLNCLCFYLVNFCDSSAPVQSNRLLLSLLVSLRQSKPQNKIQKVYGWVIMVVSIVKFI